MPDASAEGGDVDKAFAGRVGNHTMPPFEVVATNAAPCFAPVGRTPGGRLESARVERVRIAWIDGYIVDVLIAIEDAAPTHARVNREIDATAAVRLGPAAAPPGKVKATWIARIDGQP